MRTTHSGYTRLTKTHKFSAAGIAATGIAAVALAAVGGTATAAPAVKPVAQSAQSFGETQQDELTQQTDAAATQARVTAKTAVEAKQKADATAAAKAKADKERAAKERAAKEAASRSTERAALKPAKTEAKAEAAAPAPKAYGNNLDGWINQALDIMKAKGIPGSYEGIKRNIMRESTGNPQAINGWDVNAQNGIPSKGLLQIIDPTFKAYHVEGTSWDIYDPVANIVASCNYAADKYGSMDSVNSAY
ncbi:transglycosylase SLT domain-containing protein [Streptomyces sp. ET3-23]|uniref:transglycosylase SLT domain-containing protein n=1 Tax=Streptomyces sp. ET3-23 TaxID=2885643 RepID=UPI001D128156|nr:transglycosylase SLT domain-containing protein [Streptomyces sp. ET3-23]MCC2274186.1 transglycosylase SLT domain-containing protein [Streptomyces sp. ET3-23]